MIQVPIRTNIGFAAVRIAVPGVLRPSDAVAGPGGFTLKPLPDYLTRGIAGTEVDYSPLAFPNFTAPDDLRALRSPRIGDEIHAAGQADVNDTFVQILDTIGLSVRKGFDWQVFDESTLAGLRRAVPSSTRSSTSVGHDERDRQRMARVAGIRSLQLRLGPQRRQHQVPGRYRTRRPSRLRQHDGRLRESTASDENSYVLHFEPGQHRRWRACGISRCTTTRCCSLPTRLTGSRSATPPTASPPMLTDR